MPQKTLRKLEREVTLMARVSRQSSGITRLIDVYEDRSYVYIVMGLNEGGDLEELLEVCSSSASKYQHCSVTFAQVRAVLGRNI